MAADILQLDMTNGGEVVLPPHDAPHPAVARYMELQDALMLCVHTLERATNILRLALGMKA